MNIQELIKIRDAMYRDPELLAVYEKGDANSKGQTRHDYVHGDEVRDLALSLTAQLDRAFPGRLDEVTKEFVIPVSAWLHDIGRAINLDRHDVEGALLAKKYLDGKGVPRELRVRICRIIALHRAGKVIKRGIQSPEHAIVVIADKCIGDEGRVRPDKAFALRLARFFGIGKKWSLARINWWDNAPHDRVNFSIKKANLVLDFRDEAKQTGDIVLKLDVDERIANIEEIVTLDWFADSFFACGKGARYFGYYFRLEFNNVRHWWDKTANNGKGGWVPTQTIAVNRNLD
jgi:hypothetical protein